LRGDEADSQLLLLLADRVECLELDARLAPLYVLVYLVPPTPPPALRTCIVSISGRSEEASSLSATFNHIKFLFTESFCSRVDLLCKTSIKIKLLFVPFEFERDYSLRLLAMELVLLKESSVNKENVTVILAVSTLGCSTEIAEGRAEL